MSFSVNAGTFQSLKIKTEREQEFFLAQLSSLLAQVTSQVNLLRNQVTTLQGQVTILQSASGLANILNGSNALNYNALNTVVAVLGTVAVNQAVNCASAAAVCVTLTASASITLTLNNLGSAVPVALIMATTGAFVIKLAATNPAASNFTLLSYFSGGVQTGLGATGWAPGASQVRAFVGITNGLTLQMAFT